MRVISIPIPLNITHAQHIQLLFPPSTGSINREQHRPSDQTSHEADASRNFQIPQQQIRIHGVVSQHISIRQLGHGRNPAKKPGRSRGGTLLLAQGTDIGSRDILSSLTLA